MDYTESVPTTSVSIGFGILSISMAIISLIISVVMLISLIKIFTRNGKPGWGVIIPIYNFILMSEIAEVKSTYVILLFVPIANLYAMYVIYKGIAKKYNKSDGYAVGMLLLPFIFLPMLAFKKEDNTLNVNNNVNSNQFQGGMINNQEVIQPMQGQPSVAMSQEVPVNMGMQNSMPSVEQVNNVSVVPPVMPQEAPVNTEVQNSVPSVEQANNVSVVPPVMPQETPVNTEVQESIPSVEQANNVSVVPPVMPQETPVNTEIQNSMPSVEQTSNVSVVPPVMPQEAPVNTEVQNSMPSVEQTNNASTEQNAIPVNAEVQTLNEEIEEL